MSKEEIREELEFMDSSIVEAIIDCCKELYCEGIPLYEWSYNLAMERFDNATRDWED